MDTPGREVNLGRMKGRPVIDSNGDNVGTIEDVVIEPGTWRVSGFVVALRREVADSLHMPKKGFLDTGAKLEIASDRVARVGDNVILNIDRTAIADALLEGRAPGMPPPSTPDEYANPTEGAFGGYEPPRF